MKKFLAVILSLVTLFCLASCSQKETINLNNTLWVEVDDKYSGVIFWEGEPITWSVYPNYNGPACVWWEGSGYTLNAEGDSLIIDKDENQSSFGHSASLKYKDKKLKMSYKYFGIPLISHELVQINVSSLSEYYESMGIELIRQGSPEYIANTTPPGWF